MFLRSLDEIVRATFRAASGCETFAHMCTPIAGGCARAQHGMMVAHNSGILSTTFSIRMSMRDREVALSLDMINVRSTHVFICAASCAPSPRAAGCINPYPNKNADSVFAHLFLLMSSVELCRALLMAGPGMSKRGRRTFKVRSPLVLLPPPESHNLILVLQTQSRGRRTLTTSTSCAPSALLNAKGMGFRDRNSRSPRDRASSTSGGNVTYRSSNHQTASRMVQLAVRLGCYPQLGL